ncbi:ABC-2 type transport system ATP-binding protein [Planifilum fimeticola]|jgi:ABC-2 type transport system ATP-binding protein|uniref:ABC-2 type transport system ATP-binding protein n=1 Tax=Planifilum fimeticola TaxID=201975 RepID=A0A2T0LAX0_9BACL|nr:ABC transporter ATP-binding protein [Planifilum fimeticola]PRX39022.1 ABC-2 type transport system ATP-binding protein [Planifilum fimeticola]
MQTILDTRKSTETALDVRGLRKSYGNIAALQGVSFSVRSGSCFGLLGPNGAGKSTTMKILTGIVTADAGTVRVLGLDTAKQQNAIRRQVGYVPQEITLYEKLSARDNLVFFGEMYGIRGSELRQRIQEVLRATALEQRAYEPVATFSVGMKRRINIAAALLHRPKLLILDEPTVGIDPQSRNYIFEMIRSLRAQGMTIIYSTHYMEEVEALCDDIAIIDHGRVIAQGSLSDLLDRFGKKAVYVEMDGFGQLPPFPFPCKISRRDEGWMIETKYRSEAMNFLLQNAFEQKLDIRALEMVRPSLESVFLELTGTSLRD